MTNKEKHGAECRGFPNQVYLKGDCLGGACTCIPVKENAIKESLKEKFIGFHKDGKYWDISDPDDVFDFFWNEIEQIRKEDMERVVEEIENHPYIRDMHVARYRDEVLSIIKQD